MAAMNQWTPPNQPLNGPGFPSIANVLAAAGPPTSACSFRETPNHLADARPGGWTPMTDGHMGILQGRQNIIFVFMRFSSTKTSVEENLCRAGSAIVGARLHDTIRIQGQHMMGRTLIFLLDMKQKGGEPFQVFKPVPANSVGWPFFTTIMENLDRLYPGQQKPNLWLVSRSISSLPLLPNVDWVPFLQRWPAWWPFLRLIYQINTRFPNPDQPPTPAITPPWNADPVYALKWVEMPLHPFVTPTPAEPVWYAVIRHWLAEEYWCRRAGLDEVRAQQIRMRGYGRLSI